MLYTVRSELQYLLQDIKTEQPGPGDDAALARLVSSEDEVGRSQQLGLSQADFGLLVAGENKFKTHCWDTDRTHCRLTQRGSVLEQTASTLFYTSFKTSFH